MGSSAHRTVWVGNNLPHRKETRLRLSGPAGRCLIHSKKLQPSNRMDSSIGRLYLICGYFPRWTPARSWLCFRDSADDVIREQETIWWYTLWVSSTKDQLNFDSKRWSGGEAGGGLRPLSSIVAEPHADPWIRIRCHAGPCGALFMHPDSRGLASNFLCLCNQILHGSFQPLQKEWETQTPVRTFGC